MISNPKPPKRGAKPKKPLRKVKRTTRASLGREADRLWSRLVKRGGVCEFRGFAGGQDGYSDHHHECRGPLQAMHGISRRYRGTRWSPTNGFAGCASTHLFYSHREGEWQAFLVKAWGLPVYEEMWRLARAKNKPDLPAVIESLKQELAK